MSFVEPMSLTYDNPPPDGRSGVLLGFFEGKHATEASLMPPRCAGGVRWTVRQDSRAAGARAGGVRRAGLGCRGVVARLLRRAADRRFLDALCAALREPVGRIHWAGAETSDVWNGYLDGAVRSGERAAQEVAAALGSSVTAG